MKLLKTLGTQKKKQILTVLFFGLFCALMMAPLNIQSQEKSRITGIGLNLPSFIGKTFSPDIEISKHRYYSLTLGLGGMLNNTMQGSLTKIGVATYDHENSGCYLSAGARFTLRKKLNQSYFFTGAKLFGGYFYQSGHYYAPFDEWFLKGQIPDDYFFKGDRVYSKGFFTAFAIECGMDIKVADRFHTEIGLQGGHQFFTTKKQISSIYSILPGLGSLNVVGLLKLKYNICSD